MGPEGLIFQGIKPGNLLHTPRGQNNNAEWVSPISTQQVAGKVAMLLGCLDQAAGKPANPSWKKKVAGQKEVKVLERCVFRLVSGFSKETTP